MFRLLGWVGGPQIVTLIASVVSNTILARHFGPADFGLFSFFLSLNYLIMPLVACGLENVLVKDFVERPESISPSLTAALKLRVVTGVVGAVISIVLGVILRGVSPESFHVNIAVAMALVASSGAIFQLALQAQARWKPIFWVTLIATVAATLYVVLCAALGFGIETVAWVRVVDGLMVSFLSAYIILAGGTPLNKGSNELPSVRIQALLRRGAPFLTSAISVALYARLDQLMIGEMIGDKSVAVYAVAMQFSSLWYLIGGTLITATRPGILALDPNGDAMLKRMQALFELSILLGIVACFVNIVFGYILILSMFGPAYRESYYVLFILSFSVVFVPLGGARTTYIIASSLERFYPITTFLGLVANIVLNLLFIPKYGALGAAFALVVSFFVAAFASSFMFPPLRPVGWMMWQALRRPECLWNRDGIHELFRRPL